MSRPKGDNSERVFEHGVLKDIVGDRYRLGVVAGEGAGGQIVRAEDLWRSVEGFGRDVAIKFINPTQDQMSKLKQRSLTLEDIAKAEDIGLHPLNNIVPRHMGKGPKDNQFFFVMPTYRYSLEEVLDRLPKKRYAKDYGPFFVPNGQKLTLRQVSSWMRDIANALFESHYYLRTLHSDVKPGNFMVDQGHKHDIRDGRLLLTDFGNSRLGDLGYTVGPEDNKSADYTKAPECFIRGNKADKRSDVWSACAIYYRMLTGEYPFQQEIDGIMEQDIDHQEALRELFEDLHKDGKGEKILQKRIRRNVTHFNHPAEYFSGRPILGDRLQMQPLRRLLSRGLSFDADERPQDGVEFKKAVNETLETISLREHMKKQAYGTLAFVAPMVTAVICLALTPFTLPPEIRMPENRVHTFEVDRLERDEELTFQYETEGTFVTPEMSRESSIGHIHHNTRNAYAGILARCYYQTHLDLKDVIPERELPFMSPAAQDLYQSYRRKFEPDVNSKAPLESFVVAIETALTFAEDPTTGNVDVDDLMNIMMVGQDGVIDRKRIAASRGLENHERSSVYSKVEIDGDELLNNAQQRFVNRWKSYFAAEYERVNGGGDREN